MGFNSRLKGLISSTIMWKICGPTRTEDGYWRINTNQEINDILKEKYNRVF
jgi:hypothetical protein